MSNLEILHHWSAEELRAEAAIESGQLTGFGHALHRLNFGGADRAVGPQRCHAHRTSAQNCEIAHLLFAILALPDRMQMLSLSIWLSWSKNASPSVSRCCRGRSQD